MKKILLSALLLSFTGMTAFAQVNDTAEKKDSDWGEHQLIRPNTSTGFYLAFTMKGAELNTQEGLFVGAQLSFIADHKLGLGLAGYGLLTDVQSNYFDIDGDAYLYEMGYGGFMIEPVIFARSAVHLTFPILIGMGGVGESQYRAYENDYEFDEYYDYTGSNTSAFFVTEPGVNLEFNVSKGLKFDIGAGYRHVMFSNLASSSDADLSGLSGNVTMKIGWF